MKKYIRRKAAAAFIALAFLIVLPMEALAEQGVRPLELSSTVRTQIIPAGSI